MCTCGTLLTPLSLLAPRFARICRFLVAGRAATEKTASATAPVSGRWKKQITGDEGRKSELVQKRLSDLYLFLPPVKSKGNVLGVLFSDNEEACEGVGDLTWTTSPVVQPARKYDWDSYAGVFPEALGDQAGYFAEGMGLQQVGHSAEGPPKTCLYSFGRCPKNTGSNCPPTHKYLVVITASPPKLDAEFLGGDTLLSAAGNEPHNVYHFLFDYVYSLFQLRPSFSVVLNQPNYQPSAFQTSILDQVGVKEIRGPGFYRVERAYVSFLTTRPICIRGEGCGSAGLLQR